VSPIPLGVIGCGRIAQAAHLPAVAKSEDFDFVVACDRSRKLSQGVAERYGAARAVDDPEDIFRSAEVEAVLVAVPDRFHADLVARAIAAGKHVLVEKPLATSTDEAEGLVRLADASSVVVQVGSMKRHDPGVAAASAAVAREIGQVMSFTAWYRVPVRRPDVPHFPAIIEDQDVRQAENVLKADARRGPYVLATHGSHVFDTLRYVIGEVAQVDAHHREFGGQDHLWRGTAITADGAVGSFEILANAHGEWEEGMDVYGTMGTVHLRTHVPFAKRPSDVRIYTDGEGGWRVPVFDSGDAYLHQLSAFARAVRGQAKVNPGAREGLQAVRLIDAVSASAEKGAVVTV
jgi:predicted dehydrogenase